MPRKTRVSFSERDNCVDVKLPTSWAELTDEELRFYFKCQFAVGGDSARFALFRHMAHCRVCTITAKDVKLAFNCPDGGHYIWTTPERLAEQLEVLDFLMDLPKVPVRCATCGPKKVKAVDAELHGVSFGDYIQIDNAFQGYIASQDPLAVLEMAVLLYPGYDRNDGINEVDLLNILNWFTSVKLHFARMFPNFFRPAAGVRDNADLMEQMNNQIRALTGGDITKEDVVFATDCWRALTELDAKAKEAEEFNRRTAKHRK